MNTIALQIRQRGTITLPAKLRKRYNLEVGDFLTLLDFDGAFFLVPQASVVPKLVREIERLREQAGLAIQELMEGLDEERRRYYQEKYGPLVRPEIFLDSNVLIAGSASTAGARYLILQLSGLTLVECIICQQVKVETERNLQFKLPQALLAFRVLLENSVRVVEDPSPAALEPFSGQADREDLRILVAALGSGCHHLLTFNTRHYYPTTEKIKITPPGEFVTELRQQLLDLLSR